MRSAKRVLIVDDDREIVSATVLRLVAAGYDAIVAFGGQQGIDSG